MSWKCIVVGDIHLRTSEVTEDTMAALDFVVNEARRHKVDVVLFGGDVYESSSSAHERLLFAEVLQNLSFCRVYGVRGNHDAPEDLLLYNHMANNTWAEQPMVVEDGPVDLLLVPWPNRAYLAAAGYAGEAGDQAGSTALASMLVAMSALRRRPDAPLIMNAHLQGLGSLTSSSQTMVGRAIELTVGDIQEMGLAAAFISHVHRPQELGPNIWIPGSLTCHDHGEEREKKRIGLVTYENGVLTTEWIPVPGRKWLTVDAEVVDGKFIAEVWANGAGRLDPEADVAASCLRYRYRCNASEQHLFNHEEIKRRFSSAHRVKVEGEVNRQEMARSVEVVAAATPAQKLVEWGRATGTPILESHLQKLAEVLGV